MKTTFKTVFTELDDELMNLARYSGKRSCGYRHRQDKK